MSNACGSSSNKNVCEKYGACWTSTAYFYPKFKDNKQYLENEISMLVDLDEPIDHAWMYKIPLSEHQLTSLIFKHQYVVFITKSYTWSVEKFGTGIHYQVDQRRENIVSFNCDGSKRRGNPFSMRDDYGRITVRQLIDYVNDNELNIVYSYIHRFTNCKGFANRVYDKIVKG